MGCTLAECLNRVTHREYLIWQAHDELEWQIPSRDNWYAMQIAAKVIQSQTTKPDLVKTENYKMQFKTTEDKKKEEGGLTKEGLQEAHKSMWMSRAGYKKKD